MTELKNPYEDKVIDLENNKVKPISIDEMVDKNKNAIMALGQAPEQVKMQLMQAVVKNPALKQCKMETVVLAVAQVMETGLSMNPEDGEVGIVPIKQGMTSVATIRYMAKGYKRVLKRDIKGVKDVLVMAVKANDILSWSWETGEMEYSDELFSSDFQTILKRKKEPNIGWVGIITFEDGSIFGTKNIGSFMTDEDIEIHKKDYASKTSISARDFARKTLLRKVFRDFKEMFKDQIEYKEGGIKSSINALLSSDNSYSDGKTQTYIENGNERKIS